MITASELKARKQEATNVYLSKKLARETLFGPDFPPSQDELVYEPGFLELLKSKYKLDDSVPSGLTDMDGNQVGTPCEYNKYSNLCLTYKGRSISITTAKVKCSLLYGFVSIVVEHIDQTRDNNVATNLKPSNFKENTASSIAHRKNKELEEARKNTCDQDIF